MSKVEVTGPGHHPVYAYGRIDEGRYTDPPDQFKVYLNKEVQLPYDDLRDIELWIGGSKHGSFDSSPFKINRVGMEEPSTEEDPIYNLLVFPPSCSLFMITKWLDETPEHLGNLIDEVEEERFSLQDSRKLDFLCDKRMEHAFYGVHLSVKHFEQLLPPTPAASSSA